MIVALAFGGMVLSQDLPRLRTRLPNGATVLVERMPKARTLTVQLWLGVRGARDTAATAGYRHLLEHLMARQRDGEIDRKIESVGGLLRAETQPDAMVFEATVPPGRIAEAAEAVRAMLIAQPLSAEDIAREVRVIRQELALRSAGALQIDALRGQLFGPDAVGPFGDLDRMASALPAELGRLRSTLLKGPNTAVYIAGPVNLDVATDVGRRLLTPLTAEAEPWPVARPRQSVNLQQRPAAWAIDTPGYASPATAASLAAGLAMAAEIPDAWFFYRPAMGEGMVAIGSDDPGAFERVRRLRPPAAYAEDGRALAKQWLRAQLDDPRRSGHIRGLLAVLPGGVRPEALEENLALMTAAQFSEAWRRLLEEHAGVNP
jgi:hypothetical protein